MEPNVQYAVLQPCRGGRDTSTNDTMTLFFVSSGIPVPGFDVFLTLLVFKSSKFALLMFFPCDLEQAK